MRYPMIGTILYLPSGGSVRPPPNWGAGQNSDRNTGKRRLNFATEPPRHREKNPNRFHLAVQGSHLKSANDRFFIFNYPPPFQPAAV